MIELSRRENNGKAICKKYWLTLLVFILSGAIGGFLITPGVIAGYPADIREQIYAEGVNDLVLSLATGYQYAIYG